MAINTDKKITVAIYSGAIPSTTFIERLILGLSQNGFNIILFGKQTAKVSYPAGSVVVVSNRNGVAGWLQFFIRLIILLVKLPGRYKALRNHLHYGPFAGSRGYRAWQKYVPLLLHLPDVFHVQWAKAAEEWLFLKELFDVKLVLSLRGTHINTSPLADAALAASYRRAFKQYDAFHGVSHAIVKEAAYYGIDAQKAQVIYSGLPYRPLMNESNPPMEALRILAVGRFHWKKGYHYLLDALAMLNQKKVPFRLTLIAQGDLPEEILFQLLDLNLKENVNWIKGLPMPEVEKQMTNHDVLVLPSVEEGIANVVLEAMQLGLPVVSTRCGGMDEAIVHGRNGFLIPVRNPGALTEAILSVKELSLEKRDQLRQLAHESISEKFNLERNILQFGALYKRVLTCA